MRNPYRDIAVVIGLTLLAVVAVVTGMMRME